MSGTEERSAEHRPSRGYGWIWAVPIAAVGVAIWLGVRSWASSGPEVTVVFPVIANLKSGDTKVKFQDMEVGSVDTVQLEKDLKHMRVKLDLRSDMAGLLGKGTKFWVEGAQPSLSDISSIRALISGPSIGIDPASGDKQKIYYGLAERPAVEFGEQGTVFILHAHEMNSIKRNTPIYYLGESVGVIRSYRMTGQNGFDFEAYVKKPYDGFVHAGTRFWSAGPISLDTGGTGPSLQFTSIPALVQGAIDFETPDGPAAGPPAPPDKRFTLYGDRQAAIFAPVSDAVLYRVRFPDASGALAPEAAVTLDGTRIGSVVAAALFYDPASGHAGIDATIALEPSRIKLTDDAPWTDPRAQMDAMLNRLLAQGLEATMQASPPVLGGQTVDLRITPGKHGTLIPGSIPEIPSAPGGDIAGIMANVSDITTKVDEIPIRRIGDNAEHITNNANGVLEEARRQLPPTLARLRATAAQATVTLANVQAMLSQDSSALSNPEAAGLPETLYEVKQAAASLKDLTDFLDRHPAALLTGRGSQE